MAESLRDLVVSLSLNTENFTRNIRSVNKQIQEAESYFKLAAAGLDNFENTTEGLTAKLSTLERKLSLQKDVVTQYERALEQATSKLTECYNRQNDYAQRLEQARQRQSALSTEVQNATAAYTRYRDSLGESDSATIAAKANMDAAQQEYEAATQEVNKLAGQQDALRKATQNAADAVSTQQTQLNKSQAAVRETEKAIRGCSEALRLSQTNWQAAGDRMKAADTAVTSLGKQMQLAQSRFRLRYATTESKLINLKNKSVLFAQQLGDDLNPTIHSLIDGVDDLMDRFMALDEARRRQIIQTVAVAASIGPAFLAVSKLSKGLGVVTGGIGKFATAVGKAGGGFKGFMSVMGKSPSVWLALAAAVTVGTIALIDYASGAKQAREALEGMQKTAEDWKNTAAETFYGKSGAGLSFFGMSADDFRKSGEDVAQSGADWLSGLLAVWTDGKRETNAIVNEWTESFKAGTGELRTALADMKLTADQQGYTGLSAQMEDDLATLDSIDAEITKLLKKRQNRLFTEDDRIRLQELIDTREAIRIKYNLVPDTGDTGGFDTIRQKLEAEVARAQARGQDDASTEVYEQAVVAAAQGLAAINQEIDANYDKEYALIQLISDSAEREAALADLNRRYNTERRQAALEYAALLQDVVLPVWKQEDIQQAADSMDTLNQKLREYSMASESDKPALLADLNEIAASMDEDALIEYIGLLTQIQSLLDSGVTEAEIEAMFPEIDVTGAMAQLASVQDYLDTHQLELPGLASMFSEAIPEEALKIATDLDMTGAQARWNEFAANPGAITTEAIITGYRDFQKNSGLNVEVPVRLGEVDKDELTALSDSGKLKVWQDGVEIPITAVPEGTITADTIATIDEDGTLHILISPQITGTQEAIDTISPLVDEVDQLGVTAAGMWAGIMPATTMDMIASAVSRINSYTNSLDYSPWEKFWATLRGESTDQGVLDQSMRNDFSAQRVAELSAYVGEVVAAIAQGKEVSEEDLANLQAIVTFLNGLDTTDTGAHIREGVAQGMTEAGWDSDAETVASNLETALNTALGIHSPSTRMMPVGDHVAAGVGSGAAAYDFSADAAEVASQLDAAFAGAFTAATFASYDDMILTATCIIDSPERIPEIAAWLRGSGTVTFANRQGGLYQARIVNQIPFEKILRGNPHRSFAVNFRCQPFFCLQADDITVTTSGTFIANPGGIASEPVVRVTLSGDAEISIGGYLFELTGVTGTVTIDTPRLECYQDYTSRNACMAGGYPKIPAAGAYVNWSGDVEKIVITPNWRTL